MRSAAQATAPFDAGHTQFFEVRNNAIRLPSAATTYWCVAYALSDELARSKHHIVAFESVVEPASAAIVHHMELFHCAGEPASEAARRFNGECTSEAKPPGLQMCRKVTFTCI